VGAALPAGSSNPEDGSVHRGVQEELERMTQVQGQTSKQASNLKFTYESGASASFLVVRCEAEIIGYQVQMLEHNLIGHVIPPEMIKKEGVSHFYYNITSMVPLTFLLKRRKLCREEFLKLIFHITSAVNDTSGYLLEISNFIFDPEYIYISPDTMEPSLVYIPANIRRDGSRALQSFISDLLLMHIHAEGFDRGNFVQKILSAVNSDFFSVKECAALISKLMYGQGQDEETEQTAGTIPDRNVMTENERTKGGKTKGKFAENNKDINCRAKEGRLKSSIVESDGLKCDRLKNNGALEAPDCKSGKTGGKKAVIITAVMLQLFMGVIIYLSRGFLQRVGDNQTATYAAVAMIVLAIDLLLLKKIKAGELIFLRNKPGEPEKTDAAEKERPDMQPQTDSQADGNPQAGKQQDRHQQMNWHLQPDSQPDRRPQSNRLVGCSHQELDKSDCTAHPEDCRELLPDRDAMAACKTELLTCDKKGVPLLRSVGKYGINEDIVIDKDEFIIGRLAGHVDYVLNNNAVGKLHAELIRRDGTCFVRDLNSMNGTFINNQRIESNKEYELKENDRLQLANSEFVLIYG